MPSPNSAAATRPAGSSSRSDGIGIAEHDVGLAAAALPARGDAADVGRRLDRVRRAGRQVGEGGVGGAQHRLRIDRTGDADDRVRAGVLALHVVEQVLAREALDVAPRADHRLADRMGAEAGLVVQLVGGRQRVVLVLQVLVQDDLALALELGLGEGAVAHDVAEHLDEVAGIAREPRHLERGVVLVGVRVDVAPRRSASRLICWQSRSRVPLNAMCSTTWLMPFRRALSCWLPERTNTLTPTVSTWGWRMADHAHAVGQRRHGCLGIAKVVFHGVDCRAPSQTSKGVRARPSAGCINLCFRGLYP
jgi:hypothetical protein